MSDSSAATDEQHVYVSGVGGWCIRCGARKNAPQHVPAPVSFFELAKDLGSDA